jgi:RNA polymerase sigma factor (sigma-70 family)
MNPKRLSPDRQAMAAAFVGDVRNLAFAFARRNARDVPAADIVGEALVALVYAASLFDPARGVPFENWAKLVIRQAMVKAAYRWRRWGLPGSGDDEPLDTIDHRPAPEPDRQEDLEHDIDRLRRVVPPKLYELLRLHHVEGLTLTEIGKRRGLSRSRIGQLIEKGTEQARRMLPGLCEA